MNKDLKRLSALLTGLVTVFSTVGGYTPSEKRSAANSVSAASGNISLFPELSAEANSLQADAAEKSITLQISMTAAQVRSVMPSANPTVS